MAVKVTEVFVPGAFPQHTYVERTSDNFEAALRDALDTPGQIISLSGPSKSGKTVLVEKVVGQDNLIPISGASIRSPEDVWNRVLDWMDVPSTSSRQQTVSGTIGGQVGMEAGVGIPGFAKAKGSGAVMTEAKSEGGTTTVRERRGLTQVVDEIGKSDFAILLDDFHYMDRTVQVEVAKALKEAVRLDVKIITASVTHRADDVLRANPELRGRVRSIDLRYWQPAELKRIADRGFAALNAEISASAIEEFTKESAGSPQLMQLLCLQACFVLNLRVKTFTRIDADVDADTLNKILEQASASTNFRSLIDVLDAGPRTRGTERKMYDFIDGSKGDVYRVILKAIAINPPHLSFAYEDILKRTASVCKTEQPVGSSVTSTCLHMSKIAQEKFPNERAIDWDEQKQVFDIPDPYLLFYLRWSGCLRE